jgi:hypothetical protein
VIAEPNKITASTAYDFEAKNLTAYGGLLPVATMLEKLGFQQLIEETLTVKRVTRAMPMCQFILAMVLGVYVGFSRLHHLQFLAREPMLTGILKVDPPQAGVRDLRDAAGVASDIGTQRAPFVLAGKSAGKKQKYASATNRQLGFVKRYGVKEDLFLNV